MIQFLAGHLVLGTSQQCAVPVSIECSVPNTRAVCMGATEGVLVVGSLGTIRGGDFVAVEVDLPPPWACFPIVPQALYVPGFATGCERLFLSQPVVVASPCQFVVPPIVGMWVRVQSLTLALELSELRDAKVDL